MLIHPRPEFSPKEDAFYCMLLIVLVILITIMYFSKDSVNTQVDNYGWNIEKIETPSTKEKTNQNKNQQ